MVEISLSSLFRKLKRILGFGSKQKQHKKQVRRHVRFKPVNRRINYLKANGRRVLLVNNRYARNPTYSELIEFLNFDKTETISYRPHKFVCSDFAQLLHNRAEKYGIRAAWVSIDFTYGEGHACNAFRTKDRGLIFVDCTNSKTHANGEGYDSTVTVRVHEEYRPKEINQGWYYNPMGVVKKYKIFW